MKKTLTIISSLLIMASLLAACNTETEESDNSTNAQQQTDEQKNNENADSSTTEQPEEKTNEPTQSGNTVSQPAQKQLALTYTSKDKQVTKDVITSTSKELGYSILHFENYTLEAEEPGVDHLLNNEDPTVSMQIRISNTAEGSFDQVKSTTTEMMAAIAPEGKYTALDLTSVKEQYATIKNIIGFETLIDTEKVVMVTFERDNKIVTLTIYDTPEADLTDAFLQMGLTIQ